MLFVATSWLLLVLLLLVHSLTPPGALHLGSPPSSQHLLRPGSAPSALGACTAGASLAALDLQLEPTCHGQEKKKHWANRLAKDNKKQQTRNDNHNDNDTDSNNRKQETTPITQELGNVVDVDVRSCLISRQ